jgi:hypothetical protein
MDAQKKKLPFSEPSLKEEASLTNVTLFSGENI